MAPNWLTRSVPNEWPASPFFCKMCENQQDEWRSGQGLRIALGTSPMGRCVTSSWDICHVGRLVYSIISTGLIRNRWPAIDACTRYPRLTGIWHQEPKRVYNALNKKILVMRIRWQIIRIIEVRWIRKSDWNERLLFYSLQWNTSTSQNVLNDLSRSSAVSELSSINSFPYSFQIGSP